ncbi:hypothetical protein OAZ13_04230 [Gammaproteobacteria bacterium]|nr:hypothetical protein [Gammaproteobacteria bacterium]
MAKKKYRLTTCNICGSQAPANFMVRHPKKITATSRNTVGGKEVVGAILGFQTSQKALERSLLTSRKRTHTTYRTVWMCEDCSGKKSEGTIAKENQEREAKDLLNEEAKLNRDLEYLETTKLPDQTKIVKDWQNKFDAKQAEYIKVLEEGVDIFQGMRNEFDLIKKDSAENFATNLMKNEAFNKLNKNYINANSKTSKNIKGTMTQSEKLAFKVKVEELAAKIDKERKKLGTRWEDKAEMRRLLDELRVAEEKLKVTKEAHDLSVKQRFSGGLIKKYQDKKSIIDLYNEKHADVSFNDETNLFSLKNFSYKEDSLGPAISPEIQEKIDFWIGWNILFGILAVVLVFVEPESALDSIVGVGIMFMAPAIVRILVLKKGKKSPDDKIHKIFSSSLEASLKNCIDKLNKKVKEKSLSFDLNQFIDYMKESNKIATELDEIKFQLENHNKILSDDETLADEIKRNLSAITDRLAVLNSAGTIR